MKTPPCGSSFPRRQEIAQAGAGFKDATAAPELQPYGGSGRFPEKAERFALGQGDGLAVDCQEPVAVAQAGFGGGRAGQGGKAFALDSAGKRARIDFSS